MGLQWIDWDIGDVTVINLSGRITLGEGTAKLRDAVHEVLERGRRNIILNFSDVMYVDSSGLGTLVQTRGEVIAAGGLLKLMKLKEITRDLIQVTHLHMLFEVFADEDSAIRSFSAIKPD
jgi:anti-sigma B factor antagonist